MKNKQAKETKNKNDKEILGKKKVEYKEVLDNNKVAGKEILGKNEAFEKGWVMGTNEDVADYLKKDGKFVKDGKFDEDKLLEELTAYNGYSNQTLYLIEEVGELLQAISKYRRNGFENAPAEIIENLYEEIGDVQIQLEAVSKFLDKDKINKLKERKLLRIANYLSKPEK